MLVISSPNTSNVKNWYYVNNNGNDNNNNTNNNNGVAPELCLMVDTVKNYAEWN